MQELQTPDSIVLALGGVRAVADMSGRRPSTVYNWCARKRFPTKTYLSFRRELAARGYRASPVLWGMPEADEAAR